MTLNSGVKYTTLYLTGLCGYFNYCVRLTVNNRGEITFEPKLETQNLVNRENASKFQATESCWCMKNLYFLCTRKWQQNFQAFTSCTGHR